MAQNEGSLPHRFAAAEELLALDADSRDEALRAATRLDGGGCTIDACGAVLDSLQGGRLSDDAAATSYVKAAASAFPMATRFGTVSRASAAE